MVQKVFARHARAALLVVADGGAGRMLHRRNNHRLEVFRRLKGIKVIDHLTQVEDHAINRQLRHPACRIGKGHFLPCALLNHRERKAAFLGGIGDTVNHVHGTTRQVKQHDADAPVTAQLERTRGKVSSKPERLHGRMDPIACRLSHAIGLVDHTRNRLERNTRGNRHIVHRDVFLVHRCHCFSSRFYIVCFCVLAYTTCLTDKSAVYRTISTVHL